MTFLVFLIIALAWVGALWMFARERLLSPRVSGPVFPSLQNRPTSGALLPPRTASSARRRRREVLAMLLLLAITTFFLAGVWSALWAVQLIVDVALVAYGWAVFSIERPDSAPARPSLMPVLVSAADSVQTRQARQPRPGPNKSPTR